MSVCLRVCIVVLGLLGPAQAAPFIPDSDAVVLERLPEKGDPTLMRLKRMRAALASSPRNLDIALPVARGAIDAARETGDPRFLGQAQAALMPWWRLAEAPSPALLLRATLKQSQHDFAGALTDLDALLLREPTNGQALLTRATVLTVQGRYAQALDDCARLAGRTSRLVVAACTGAPASLSGAARLAYDTLQAALLDARDPSGVREWGLTLGAEIAVRAGDAQAAERNFRAALAFDPRDPYLKAAYADFLLDQSRSDEVVVLLRDDLRNDSLLLRLALAEQNLPSQHEAFATHRRELSDRFDAARRRGDSLHQREEARFRLAIEHDAAAAVTLARANWAVQREPADLRILFESAQTAHDTQALSWAREFALQNRIQDMEPIAALGASK